MVRRIYLYNLLNGIQVFLGLVFQFMVARRFGAGVETDVYFLSTIMVTTLSTVTLFFVEMFLQHYNDLFISNEIEAESFYQAVYTLSIVIGLATYIISVLLLQPLIVLFAPGFDSVRVEIFRNFFVIQASSLILVRTTGVNNGLINARMRFMLPYVLGIATPAINIIMLILFEQFMGIHAIAVSTVLAVIVTIAAQQTFVRYKLGVRMRLRFHHPLLRQLFLTSFPLRLGHQVGGLRDIITTNILSYHPVGTISLFTYAWKIINIIFIVTNSPVLQIFQSKSSRMTSEGNLSEISKLRNEVMWKNGALFFLSVVPAVIFLPTILKIFFSASIEVVGLQTIFLLFLTLIPVHLLMTIEMPFLQVMMALKRGWLVLQVNFLYILFFASIVFTFRDMIGIYAISAALFITACINVLLYNRFEKRCLSEPGWNGYILDRLWLR